MAFTKTRASSTRIPSLRPQTPSGRFPRPSPGGAARGLRENQQRPPSRPKEAHLLEAGFSTRLTRHGRGGR
eukprot:7512438-Pyramimonas_sp.AAC.1